MTIKPRVGPKSVIAVIAGLLPIIVLIVAVVRQGREKEIRLPTVPGELVVGFARDVRPEQARATLEKHHLKYRETADLNAGREFWESTGAKFIVYVTKGEEATWQKNLEAEPDVKEVSRHNDPLKVIVD